MIDSIDPRTVPFRVLLLGALFLVGLPTAALADPLDTLLEGANATRWPARSKAVRALAKLPQDDRIFKLRMLLRTDKRPKVREAIAWAGYLEPDLLNATLLGISVRKDPEPRVRRAAAFALTRYRDRRSVGALVKAIQTETDHRTRLRIVQSLTELTSAPCLLDKVAWKTWWSKHEGDAALRPADVAPERSEYDGVVLETRTVAAVRRKDAAKKPLPHVLVLPGFGWNTEIYGSYLLPLRQRAALTFVRLPSVQTLTGRSGYGNDVGTYPVARLVRALERFRESHKIERFLILAPGATGWIAMRYAQAHKKACAGLILLDTALDRQAYAVALRRAARRGTKAEKFTAKTLLHENGLPFNEATLKKLHATALERSFYDPSDLEIAYFYRYASEPQGFAMVPPIAFSGRVRIETPTVFVYSGASAFSTHHEAARILKHFPNSLVTPIRGARGMPYVETNQEFHRVLDFFFKRYFD